MRAQVLEQMDYLQLYDRTNCYYIVQHSRASNVPTNEILQNDV